MNLEDLIADARLSRRRALQVIGNSLTAAGSLALLAACAKEGGEAKPATPPPAAEKPAAGGELNCGAQGGIDDASKNMRKTLQYVEKSTKPGKNCSNCSQYVANTTGGPCGGCKLFTGPVNPNGNCLSHAPVAPT